jgi:hypothetical protein
MPDNFSNANKSYKAQKNSPIELEIGSFSLQPKANCLLLKLQMVNNQYPIIENSPISPQRAATFFIIL